MELPLHLCTVLQHLEVGLPCMAPRHLCMMLETEHLIMAVAHLHTQAWDTRKVPGHLVKILLFDLSTNVMPI